MSIEGFASEYLFNHGRLLVLLMDSRLNILKVSPGSTHSLGYPPDEMIGKNLYELLMADDDEATYRLDSAQSFEDVTIRLRSAGGEALTFYSSFYRDSERLLLIGDNIGGQRMQNKDVTMELHKQTFHLSKTIEELQHRNENLIRSIQVMRNRSVTDLNTDLYKRQFFERLIKAEWERARRFYGNLSLLLVRIDGLQAFRELQGDDAAAAVVRGVARVLDSRKRQFDILGHYDNDTFFMILPHTASDGAMGFAGRLVQLLEKRQVNAGDYPFRIFLSIGVATYNHRNFPLRGYEELLHQAGDALTQAQISGGNQMRFNQTPLETYQAYTS